MDDDNKIETMVDINELKRYDVEKNFTEIVKSCSSKNAALISFITDLLKKIQEDEIYVLAEIDRKISELLVNDYKSILVSMFEDDTFIDRISEIIRNNKTTENTQTETQTETETKPTPAQEKKQTEAKSEPTKEIDIDNLVSTIDSSLRRHLEKFQHEVGKKISAIKKNDEKSNKEEEDTSPKKIQKEPTPSSPSIEKNKVRNLNQNPNLKPKTNNKIKKSPLVIKPRLISGKKTFDYGKTKKISNPLRPMLNVFMFTKDIDKHVISFTNFTFVGFKNIVERTGKTIINTTSKVAKKLAKPVAKTILYGLFGPVGLILLPIAKVAGFGLKLVGAVFDFSKWIIKGIGKLIGKIISPFTSIFSKAFNKISNGDNIIITQLKRFILSPPGMFMLGVAVGSIINMLKSKFVNKPEEVDEAENEATEEDEKNKELTEQEIQKIHDRFDNYVITGIWWDISAFLFGKGGAEKLDEYFSYIDTLINGWEHTKNQREKNLSNALAQASGKKEDNPESNENPNMSFSDKLKSTIESIKTTLGNIKKKIFESKVYKDFIENKEFFPSLIAISNTIQKLAVSLYAEFKDIFGNIIYRSGGLVLGAAFKTTLNVISFFKSGVSLALFTHPATWIVLLVAALGNGIVDAVKKIVLGKKDELEKKERIEINQRLAGKNLLKLSTGGDLDSDEYQLLEKKEQDFSFFKSGRQSFGDIYEAEYAKAHNALMDREKSSSGGGGLNLKSLLYNQEEAIAQIEKMQSNAGVPPVSHPEPVPESEDTEEDIEEDTEKDEKEDTEKDEEDKNIENNDKDVETPGDDTKPKDKEPPEGIEKQETRKIRNDVKRTLSSLLENELSNVDEKNPNFSKTLLPEKFDNNKILKANDKDPVELSVPENINAGYFRLARAMFLKNLLLKNRSGLISDEKLINLYNRSSKPEDSIYKIYPISQPESFKKSWQYVSSQDIQKLNATFGGKDESTTRAYLKNADQIPYYLIFRKYKYELQKKDKGRIPDSVANNVNAWKGFVKDNKISETAPVNNELAIQQILDSDIEKYDISNPYKWIMFDSESGKMEKVYFNYERRYKIILKMIEKRNANILKNIKFDELMEGVDETEDYEAYNQLKDMYDLFILELDKMDNNDIQTAVENFRKLFEKKKEELLKKSKKIEDTVEDISKKEENAKKDAQANLELKLEEQGTLEASASTASKEIEQAKTKAKENLKNEASEVEDLAEKNKEDFDRNKMEVEQLDTETEELIAEIKKVDEEIEKVDNDSQPQQQTQQQQIESETNESKLSNERSTKYRNPASEHRSSGLGNSTPKRNFYSIGGQHRHH